MSNLYSQILTYSCIFYCFWSTISIELHLICRFFDHEVEMEIDWGTQASSSLPLHILLSQMRGCTLIMHIVMVSHVSCMWQYCWQICDSSNLAVIWNCISSGKCGRFNSTLKAILEWKVNWLIWASHHKQTGSEQRRLSYIELMQLSTQPTNCLTIYILWSTRSRSSSNTSSRTRNPRGRQFQ